MAENFILEQELRTNTCDESQIENRIEVSRQIRNTVLGGLVKRYHQMKRTKEYQKTKRQLSAVGKKLSLIENKKDEDSKRGKKRLKMELQLLYDALNTLKVEFRLSKSEAEKDMKSIRTHFHDLLDANTGQKMAERAWISVEKLMNGTSKQVVFKKKGEVRSIEGKTNKQGIRFINNTVYLNKKHSIPIIRKKHDSYAVELLKDIEEGKRKVKYCRIIRKVIRGKNRYYVQLVLGGEAPLKRCGITGRFKRQLGYGEVGVDIGTQSVAVVGHQRVSLINLSPETNGLGRELDLLNRKMERSRRSMNPLKYNENGTINTKNKEPWFFSNRYLKDKAKRKELYRKQSDIRRQSHNKETNVFLSFGHHFYAEKMSFHGLQKRSLKTEKNEKGKFKKKKRFGKSIGNKAPSLFLQLLKQKVERLGGVYQEVNTQTFKASQYDHIKDGFIKKKLSHRWHEFEDGTRVQRDLYSSFLLQNSIPDGTQTDRNRCIETFECFKMMHDEEIKKIQEKGILIKNAGIKIPAFI